MEERGRGGDNNNSVFPPAIKRFEKKHKKHYNQPPTQRRRAQLFVGFEAGRHGLGAGQGCEGGAMSKREREQSGGCRKPLINVLFKRTFGAPDQGQMLEV
jgi:hypothetical protein